MSKSLTKTRTMVECALMIALATILAYIPFIELPQGGSITLCSMLPIMVVGWRHGLKWGLFTGFVHGIIQMMLGFKNVMYCATFGTMILCILLDYLIAFTVLGGVSLISKPMKNSTAGIAISSVVVGLVRYLCSFLSGILIWGTYAPEDTPVWLYSLSYNGSYMIPEIVITAIAAVLVARLVLPRLPQPVE
ncbi:MAG: energy-coupled thiamine transporter ThiT [Oscillospiraceae bacterium]|nr:energy-coupled thiamine transporter ThiT [Oscillospiraceae bacterium]